MSTLYTMVAPCFFGTESTLNFEVKRLGAQNIQVTDGRVAFQGGADVIAAANLNLRTAERVLLLLATYKATTFDELFDGCYNIAWEDLLPANAAFPVKGSSLSSQLSSVPACQSIVKKAIVKRLMYGHKVGTLPEDGALYKVRFALRKDTVEIYLDTSGDGLHKRGYRKNATLAPIGTILAAAMMLRYSFDMAAEADAIERAVDKTLRSGFRCGDIMQENCQLVGCKAMGAEIRSRI